MANPIYELYEKEVAKNERLSKKYEKVKIELDSIKAENKRLQKKVDEIDEYIERSITKAVNKITEQFEEKIQRLEEQIQMKDAEIDRLRNHINKNSTNSSKPSSTDIVSVKTEKSSANQYNYRIRTYRKSGGQFGHKGHCLRKRKIENMMKRGLFEVKEFCHLIKGAETKKDIVKYKIGLKVITILEKHRFIHKPEYIESIPKEFYPEVTYDKSIKTLVVELGQEHAISYNRIVSFISALSNNKINLSEGSVKNFYQEFYNKSKKTTKNIENNVLNENVMHTDETTTKMNGKLCYVRGYSNKKNVLYKAHKSKGNKPIEEDNIYLGCIVADHDIGVYKYGKSHQECIVHIGRYLEEINQNVKETNWQREMSSFFFRVNQTRKIAMQYKKKKFEEYEIERYEKEYDEILERAKIENREIESVVYKAKAEKLRRRLLKYKESQLLYIRDYNIPFDNNLIERDLRMIKNKTKISGGFRTVEGAKEFASSMSVIKTSIKRKINPLGSIRDIFDDKELFGYQG